MKQISTLIRVVAVLSIAALLPACATTSDDHFPSMPTSQAPDIMHKVRPHDSLGDIAYEYTQDASNWEILAQHNNIANSRQLRLGSQIAIPAYLIEQATQYGQAESFGKIPQTQLIRVNTSASATPRAAVEPKRQQNEVIVKPVSSNKSFSMSPIDTTVSQQNTVSKTPAAKVKVLGSYYPKGIYRQPANYSTLIMRVAPGTLFDLEYLANDWYKIKTADGSAYLRADDGKVIMSESQR